MALYIYSDPNISAELTQGTYLKPFTVTFDGRTGGAIDKHLYVRNNESNKYYTDIVVDLLDSSTVDDWTDNSKLGFYWKLSTKDIVPTSEEWELISPGNSITLSNIGNLYFGDISTYLSFWVRVVIPHNQAVTVRKTIHIRIQSTEHLI